MNLDSAENYPSLDEVIKRLNKLSKADLAESTKIENVSALARVHLNQFLKEWVVDDIGLGNYLSNIPEDYPRDDALMLGDLLVFLMMGGDIKPFGNKKGDFKRPYIELDGGASMPLENRWQDFLNPMRKKMPKGKSFADLIGVHAMVLYSLPQKKYHRYNLEQIFQDDPSMAESLFGTSGTRMAPVDFDTLTNLRSIVRRGAIQQFSLALGAGTEGLKDMAGENQFFGSRLMDAFRIAESAVAFFDKGDYLNAVERLKILQEEYQIGAGAFASNMSHMFVATLSSTKDSIVKGKGHVPVLMSLDTKFKPGNMASNANMQDAAVGAQNAAMMPAMLYNQNGNLSEVGDKEGLVTGTSGQKSFVALEKGASDQKLSAVGKGNDRKWMLQTSTDWLPIFAAAYVFSNPGADEKSVTVDTLNAGKSGMFEEDYQPVLKFLVHGAYEEGKLTNLMPIGILTVTLAQNDAFGSDKNKNLIVNNNSAFRGYEASLFYESFSAVDDVAEGLASHDLSGDDEIEGGILERMDMGRPARREAAKKPSKKKPSIGQMIAVELVPSTQVRLSSADDNAKWFKQKMATDDSGKLKSLWNEFGRGAPKFKKVRGKWEWKGKTYDTKQEAMEAFNAGTYADKKGGKANMRMIYAKRKDNDEYVPFRIFIPKVLVRQRAGQLLPKKGGFYDATKMLLDIIKREFGEIVLKRQQSGRGGYDTTKGRKTVSVDRGIHLLFMTKGLDAGSGYSSNARPSRVRSDGSIIYQAITPTGTSVEMEVSQ